MDLYQDEEFDDDADREINNDFFFTPPHDQISNITKSNEFKRHNFEYQRGSWSSCFAVHGNYTIKEKPYLACDPHHIK